MFQGAPIVVGKVAIPCCMHVSRFFIKTPSQLALTTKSLIECTIKRIRSWVLFVIGIVRWFILLANSRFEVEYITKILKVGSEERQIFKCSLCTNGLELEDELILFGKILSCRVR